MASGRGQRIGRRLCKPTILCLPLPGLFRPRHPGLTLSLLPPLHSSLPLTSYPSFSHLSSSFLPYANLVPLNPLFSLHLGLPTSFLSFFFIILRLFFRSFLFHHCLVLSRPLTFSLYIRSQYHPNILLLLQLIQAVSSNEGFSEFLFSK